MSLHDLKNPRHTRIFELLRQNDAAIDTSEQIKAHPVRPLSVADVDTLKRVALKSLVRSDVGLVGAKPGRNNKLF